MLKQILIKNFFLFLIFSLVNINLVANNIMILKLTYGDVEIELYPDKAPNRSKISPYQIVENMVGWFSRVIDGFMAQQEMSIGNSITQTLIYH